MWRTRQNKSPWDSFCKCRCLFMLVCLFINLLHSDSMNMFSFISLMKRSTFAAAHLLPSPIFVYFFPNRLPIPLLSLLPLQHWTLLFLSRALVSLLRIPKVNRLSPCSSSCDILAIYPWRCDPGRPPQPHPVSSSWTFGGASISMSPVWQSRRCINKCLQRTDSSGLNNL